MLELPVNHQRVSGSSSSSSSSNRLFVGVTTAGLQRRDIARYPSMLAVVVVGVRVGLRMRVRVVVVSVVVMLMLMLMLVVVVRMLVYRHGPGMRLKIASRVIIQPD